MIVNGEICLALTVTIGRCLKCLMSLSKPKKLKLSSLSMEEFLIFFYEEDESDKMYILIFLSTLVLEVGGFIGTIIIIIKYVNSMNWFYS